jgi:hypothetical protein
MLDQGMKNVESARTNRRRAAVDQQLAAFGMQFEAAEGERGRHCGSKACWGGIDESTLIRWMRAESPPLPVP